MKLLKRSTIFGILSVFLLHPSTIQAAPKKNVILLIMDGTNSDVLTLSRWYRGTDLHLDDILAGGVRTYSGESAITDSAAAGTAMATGFKTMVDHIGMNPDSQPVLTSPRSCKTFRLRNWNCFDFTSPACNASCVHFPCNQSGIL